MKKLKYSLLLILLIPALHAAAQQDIDVTTMAAPFLRIPTEVKASGMGSTGIATAPDAGAMFYNIGKLPFAGTKGAVTANYTPWLKEWGSGMFLASIGGYYKITENQAIYSVIRYFNPGQLQFTDGSGNHLQTYRPNESAFDLGYSLKLSDNLGLGIGVKYIRSDLATGFQNGRDYKVANSVAGDIGLYYEGRKENESGWSFGAQVSNLGSKISYAKQDDRKSFIPANLGLGSSFTKVFDEQNRISFAVDLNKLLVPGPTSDSVELVARQNKSVVGSWFSSLSDASLGEELKEFQISAGAEYWYDNLFAVRLGYFYENNRIGGRKYFTFGTSIKYNILTAGFAYLAPGSGKVNNALANTLQFGITLDIK
jgi:hypothetical protein